MLWLSRVAFKTFLQAMEGSMLFNLETNFFFLAINYRYDKIIMSCCSGI